MIDSTKAITLSLLALLIGGCASTQKSKFGGTSDSRAMAVVGDHPMPSTVGEPGGQVSASEVEPEPRRSSVARISGRVLDDQGQPVPDATVRLADGGVKGGRDIQVQTDASGAFTLGGLRQGSTYTLIGEVEDGQDRKIGRTRAKTSETGVEINLMAKDDGSTATHSPAKASRVKPISNLEDEQAADDDRPRINREDVSLPGEDPGPTAPGTPRMAKPEPIGWRNKSGGAARAPKDDDEQVESVAATSSDRRTRRPKPTTPPDEDDADGGVNPLPPAIELGPEEASPARTSPRKVSARPARPAGDAEQVAVAPKSQRKNDRRESAPPALPSLGADELAIGNPLPEALPAGDPQAGLLTGPPASHPTQNGGLTQPFAGQPMTKEPPSVAESPPPIGSITTDSPPTRPASQPVFASTEPAKAPEPEGPYNPFALVAATDLAAATHPETTPAESVAPQSRSLSSEPDPKSQVSEPVPAAEAPADPVVAPPPTGKKTWGDLSVQQTKAPATRPAKATSFLARFKPSGPADSKKDVAIASVLYDPKAHRLTDFILPDLQGNPVRFQDLDADFVLLDFWGTQYKTCLDSIPHLVGLQKQYGPNKLKVVGIACEKGLTTARKSQVDDYSRKLGINYAVLLSDMNATCPVRQALDVRYYPTMILLDRQGQVVWKGEGATPLNLSKLDQTLAKNLKSTTARR